MASRSTSSTNSLRDSLLDLPEELIEYIAALIPPESDLLLDLSITCRAVRRITLNLLLTRFFTNRTFLLADRASLGTLRSISQHEIFAKSIQRISFSFATLKKASGQVQKDIEADIRMQREHKRLLKAERQFRDKAADVQLLSEILANFRDMGHHPALVAGGYDFASERYQKNAWGYKRMMRQLCWPTVRCMNVNMEDQTRFTLLYQAIRQARYPVPHLELGYAAYGVPISLFEPFRGSLAFSRLRELHLAIEPTQQDLLDADQRRMDRFDTRLACFGDFLHECQSLVTLALTRTHYNLGTSISLLIFSSVVRAVTNHKPALQHLQSFSLEGFAFLWKDLKTFVTATQSSLESLTVVNEQTTQIPSPVEAAREVREAYGADDLELRGEMFGEFTTDSESDGLFD